MALVHEEGPGLEAQASPLRKDSVDGLTCRLWEVGPEQHLHVVRLGGDEGVQLGNLYDTEPEVIGEVEEDREG